MKPMDLLHYMDMADPAFVSEASEVGVRAWRRRRRGTLLTVAASMAACLAVVLCVGTLLAKPAQYVWETRNTVTSWSNPYLQIPGMVEKPSSSLLVSAELPVQKKMASSAPFSLSVGLGQAHSYEYATLSVKAYGFEITDKDGNTARDRYVRTLSDFDSGDFGLACEDSFGQERRTGCLYSEAFTFRFVGSESFTGWGPIEISLLTRGEGSYEREHVTVYYTLENGELKLSRKNPVKDGNQNGGQHAVLVPEEEEIIPTEENIAVRADMSAGILRRGEHCILELTARVQPRGEIYPTDGFTATLRYAETVGEGDYSFLLRDTKMQAALLGLEELYYPVPWDAPAGSYDLVITDTETGFEWVLENVAWILPKEYYLGWIPPAYEDFSCNVTVNRPTLAQGEGWPGAIFLDLTLDGQDRSLFCTVELVYAEDGGDACTITLKEPSYSSHLPATFVPADAPVGGYDLVITEQQYGYTWRYNHILEITENPDAPRYVFHTDIEDVLTVSRSSKEAYCFTAIVENRMMDFTLHEGGRFSPSVGLTMVTGDAPGATILCKDMSLTNVTEIRTVRTGQMGTCRYELILTPDTPCGLYDLTLSYGGESVTLSQAVRVVE